MRAFLFLWFMLPAICLPQSEQLDNPVNYEAFGLVLEGCRHNLPLYFDHCISDQNPYSEHQIGEAIKACNVETWDKFFVCIIKGGFPIEVKK